LQTNETLKDICDHTHLVRRPFLTIVFTPVHSTHQASESKPTPVAAPVQEPPPSPWIESSNAIDGTPTTTAFSSGLYIRKTGKKIEVHYDTGKFLETVEHMHDGIVRYKFDDGAIIRQAWSQSNDHEPFSIPAILGRFSSSW
jgi:hypothetical protein